MHSENIKYSYTQEEWDKIGNTLIYLTNEIGSCSKTKLLKLMYILDELSIKKSGIPFLNLRYELWKFGPVAQDVFVELSSTPTRLSPFVKIENSGNSSFIRPVASFNDDEFTDNDVDLIKQVISKYGGKSAKDLIEITHRPNSPWYNTAVSKGLLDDLLSEEINSTNIKIDMAELVTFDERKKQIYQDYIEYH
ncbi:MAG: Panacea domain-containing protein [Crocinitomicaceae bacterium]